MGLIHGPRVVKSIARGFLQRRRQLRLEDDHKIANGTTAAASPTRILSRSSGLSPLHDPYLYQARVGVFDYLFGHMNNASYLSHAELARWEMLTYSGLLSHMMNTSTHLVVAGTTIRYRQEIKPLFCQFHIESMFAGMDHRHMWAIHNFRVGDPQESAASRIRAQMIVPCVWVQNRQVVDPRTFLTQAGVDEATIESLSLPTTNNRSDDSNLDLHLNEMTSRYAAIEDWMRQYASSQEQKRKEN